MRRPWVPARTAGLRLHRGMFEALAVLYGDAPR